MFLDVLKEDFHWWRRDRWVTAGGSGFGISVISYGLSVFLLFLFDPSYEIHLHALPMQNRGGVLQFKQLVNKFESLQVQIPRGRFLEVQTSNKPYGA